MFFKDAWKALFYGRVSPIEVVSETKYQVIEVRAPRITTKWTKEIKDAISTLPSHPGFVAIMDRFALQKQMLEHKCSHEFHKDLREADYLQAGIFWLGYAQDLVNQATKLVSPSPVDAFEEEMEAFKQIDSQIERIGMDSQSPQQ